MEICVSNVKISCKVQICNKNSISFNRDIPLKCYNNFSVIKTKYTYIIFTKTKIHRKFHVNITKIPSLDHISKAIDELKNIIKEPFLVENLKIENITCLHVLEKNINLLETFKNLKKNQYEENNDLKKNQYEENNDLKGNNIIVQVQYNPEKFPGIFLKLETCSVLLFSSGKLVVIGATSEEEAKKGISSVLNMLKELKAD